VPTIRQIAALPYRIDGDALDAPARILLVTSRGTGRWVLPKGNVIRDLSPHASAAAEAEEEAGILGLACPTSIGSYSYRKTRKSGASLKAEVDVFPILVTEELDEWEEQEFRERRWFSLAEAAEAVNEPDLKVLIRQFRASEVNVAVRSGPLAQTIKGGNKMFGWFQRLLPRQENFFDLFEAHGKTLVAGAEALSRLLQGGPNMAEHIKEISEREHDADDIIRHVLSSVRRTFLTPFDRGSITSLIGSMDDAIDQMNQTAGAIDLYEVTGFEQEMKDMAAIIVDASRVLAEALPLLRHISSNGARLHELTERLVRMEGEADNIHDAGLRALFKAHGASNTLRFIVSREIYGHLERVIDRFEDVANEIDGLVIDHA
jgi:predicted phosphate transport protein (TIGR00153 family)